MARVLLRYPFCSSRKIQRLINEYLIFSLICAVSIFHIIGRHFGGLQLVGAVSLRGSFWIRMVFTYDHPFGYLSFLYAFIHFSSKSVVYGGEYFKPSIIIIIIIRLFSFFFSWYLSTFSLFLVI